MTNFFDQFDTKKTYRNDIGALDMTEADILSAIGGGPQSEGNFFDQFDSEQPQMAQATKQYDRRTAGFSERVDEAIRNRGSQVDTIVNQAVQGQIGDTEGAGRIGLKYAQIPFDVVGEAATSVFRALPDAIENPIRKGAANVYSAAASLPVVGGGTLGSTIPGELQMLQERYPVASGRVGSVLDAGNLVAGFLPIKGTSAIGASGKVIGKTAKTIGAAPIKAATATTIGTAKGLNKVLEAVGKKASESVVRSNLPKEFKNLPKAEALFLRTLKNEGISPDDALSALQQSQALGVSPSIASAADVPSMKEMGFLMGRGSQGSKVASQAIKDIEINQIPKLNQEIIKKAAGSNLSAEAYGQQISSLSKKAIENQKIKLATRAKPDYQASVGVDKSVDINNPLMQKSLQNPLVVKALEDARTDPFTLTNVQKELAELGVDSGDLAKLPYNSTVSLHAARTHLRSLGDAAYRAGETQKGKAIKSALSDIDAAIESQFPAYKRARFIYSEDSGALKALSDSPIGQMAKMGDGDLSKIANSFLTKDPQYINKFFAQAKTAGVDEGKFRQSIAGAYLKRKLEDSAKDGVRFSDSVLKNETTRNQLKAVVGDEIFSKIEAVNKVIDELNDTRSMVQGSRTSVVNSIRDEAAEGFIPTSRDELLMQLKAKYTPSLIDMVKNDPKSAARFNELLFTDEGFKLLESMKGTKKLTVGDQNKLGNFFKRTKVK